MIATIDRVIAWDDAHADDYARREAAKAGLKRMRSTRDDAKFGIKRILADFIFGAACGFEGPVRVCGDADGTFKSAAPRAPFV